MSYKSIENEVRTEFVTIKKNESLDMRAMELIKAMNKQGWYEWKDHETLETSPLGEKVLFMQFVKG